MGTPAMTPPPSMEQGPDQGSPAENASPVQAAPAPPQPSPHVSMGTRKAINIVKELRELTKMFPGTGPAVSEINDKMRDVLKAIMTSGTPGEAAAPPTGG